MSKKMRGVALDPGPYGGYEDAKARFKHQTLIQDYRELEKEAEAMRNKLKITKQKKITLLAEVRFLRRRYKHLLKDKAIKPPQARELVQLQNLESQQKITVKGKTYNRKKTNLQNLPKVSEANQKKKSFTPKESAFRKPSPVLDLNQKDRIRSSGKEATFRNPSPIFDLNLKEKSHSRKEASLRKAAPTFDLNKKRLYIGKETGPRNVAPSFDLNQTERTFIGREDVKRRAPIFDLNQISGEEELQDNYEPMKVEEHNDVKLSACRNVGNGSNRAVKRKITWQDQVALKV